jgi:hypothetical protein
MAVEETVGYGSRLISAIKGVLVGVLFFFASFFLLWWNEGRAVQTAKSLREGASTVVSVTSLDGAAIVVAGIVGASLTISMMRRARAAKAARPPA